MNIVIPIGGGDLEKDSTEYGYPMPLIDIQGKPLVQHTIENLLGIKEPIKFIFIINEILIKKYHFDNTLKLIIENSSIFTIKGKTKGAVCSILLSIDAINNEEELIIVNSNQFIDINYNDTLSKIRKTDSDGAVLTFNSVHPRWSYVRLLEGKVVETAEKNPITNNAIAGFYYFRKGEHFVKNAFKVIDNDANFEGNYYTSSIYNEMILENLKITNIEIPANKYYSFYSSQKIKEFEEFLVSKK